jgi:hypothetical protein
MATTFIQRDAPAQRGVAVLNDLDGSPQWMVLEGVDDALEGLNVRVNAIHAHRASLNRAAQGLGAMQRTLEFVLDDATSHSGWTPEAHRAHAALAVMAEHIDHVLRSDSEMELEAQRECLQHALFQARDALMLLHCEAP